MNPAALILMALLAAQDAGSVPPQPSTAPQAPAPAAPASLAWEAVAAPATLSVTSASVNGGRFVDAVSGYGPGRSPQIGWAGAPAGTKSFAILLEDRDAARGGVPILHWLVFDIPPSTTSLPEGASSDAASGFKQGANVAGAAVYRGPHPPQGTHRYAIQVYAVDRMLDLPSGAARPVVLEALTGHVLAKGRLDAASSAPEGAGRPAGAATRP